MRGLKYREGKGLLVYQNTLFDLCPELLTLDGAHGDKLFRDFIRHVNYSRRVFDWAQPLTLYRWLECSAYAQALASKHLDAVMAAAVSLWCEKDNSAHAGVAVVHRKSSMMLLSWKSTGLRGHSGLEVLPSERQLLSTGGFAFCQVSNNSYPLPQHFQVLN